MFYKYADLSAVYDAVRKPLAENGLALTHSLDGEDLVCRLIHVSGEQVVSVVHVGRPGNDWKEFGSKLTYATRYCVSGLLALASEEDMDAPIDKSRNGNAEPAKPPARQPSAKPAAAQPSESEKSIEDKADETAKKAAHTARKAADACDTPGKLSSMAQRYKNRTLGERKAIHESALARGWQWDKEKKSYGGDPDPEITVDELHPVDKDGNPVF